LDVREKDERKGRSMRGRCESTEKSEGKEGREIKKEKKKERARKSREKKRVEKNGSMKVRGKRDKKIGRRKMSVPAFLPPVRLNNGSADQKR
jgi:hypothetical protein